MSLSWGTIPQPSVGLRSQPPRALLHHPTRSRRILRPSSAPSRSKCRWKSCSRSSRVPFRKVTPLAQALKELREEGHIDLPRIETPPAKPRQSQKAWTPSQWTPAQERALAEVVSMDHVRRVWMGSLEITELIRRQVLHEMASMTAAELGAAAPGAPTSPSGAITGISSPVHKAANQDRGFWFNVNAELIVYGATEVDASVTIGGRPIRLRPDGSFSYRFALPDGKYEMPVVAISADQTDGRAAEIKFSRGTEYRGDVGTHPQDPSLQQLLLENF